MEKKEILYLIILNPYDMQIIKIILLLFLVLLLATKCSPDRYEPPSDPKKAILGKWIVIETGNYPFMEKEPNPGWYCEYKTDSIKLYHFSDTEIYRRIYWIDSIYHEKTTILNGPTIITESNYFFYDDKLRLEAISFDATYRSAIFKRIR